MTNQRRWKTIAIAGTLGVTATGIGLALTGQFSASRPATQTQTRATANPAPESPMAKLAGPIASGDVKALTSLCDLVVPKNGQSSHVVVAPSEAPDLLRSSRASRLASSRTRPRAGPR